MLDTVNDQVLTPLRFLKRSAAVFPDATAVVDGDLRWTYRELADHVDRFARALVASGVGKGDRVAAMLPNRAEFVAAHYAVPLVGALLVSINTRLSTDEIAYILGHSKSQVFLIDGEYAEHAAAADGLDVVSVGAGEVPAATAYADFLDRSGDEPLVIPDIAELDPISIKTPPAPPASRRA